MRILHLNVTYGVGSTGSLTKTIHEYLLSQNEDSLVLYSDGKTNARNTKKYMNKFERNMFSLSSHLFGHYGFEGTMATRKIIKNIKKFKPDIIQIHNIHSHNCNLKKLFNFLNKTDIQVFYSLHDCWPFTGYCAHFEQINCNKWKDKCYECPVYRRYSWFFDKSTANYTKKRALLTESKNLHLIFASKWITNTAKQSFLQDKNMYIIENGIDQSVFYPRENKNFKDVFKFDAINVIGVAFNFTSEKGLDDFVKLENLVDDKIKIILVGNIDSTISLPKNITHIKQLTDRNLLAELMSNADIYLNLTKAETFGLTNIEALSTGTPVITYNNGGSPETITEGCGVVIDDGDINGVIKAILKVGKKTPEITRNCLIHAEKYSSKNMARRYYQLYKDILNNNKSEEQI